MEKIKIFVVDDSMVARSMLNRILSTQEDFDVVGEVGSGQGSIIMLEEVNPDVVMLETAITGGMKITDVVKEIKQINPNVKIILCTDTSAMDQVIAATEVGADDFIKKPYKKESITRIVREVVNR